MKNKSISTILSSTIVMLFATLFLTVSCRKEKHEDKAGPELFSVTDLNNRTLALNAINYGDWIIIKGKHLATTYEVDFNSILAADSLIYADDSTVTVKVPSVLPDPSNNPITVRTKYGSATLNFRILQPAPVISSFDPMAGPSGQTVTIVGNYFGGVSSVMFGTVAATILSSTKEEIKVSVPSGVTSCYITVTTASGSVTSSQIYGFSYQIYDDALATGWSNTSYSATTTLNSTTQIRRGTNSMNTRCTVSWGAFRLTKATPAISLAGMRGFKLSIYVPAASVGKKVKMSINGVTASGYTITMAKQGWIDYQIPLINVGNPTTLSSITIQEFSGIVQEWFVDDLGVY